MEYLIASGAVLERGMPARLTLASLHAQLEHPLPGLRAVLIDFDASSPQQVSRLVAVIAGWTRSRFGAEVGAALRRRGDCSFADVAAAIARGAETSEVHLFAHWLPSEAMAADLDAAGIRLIVHPIETIGGAALVHADGRIRAA